ncbi:MAG: zinc ribbon domain-containing protein [Candidatus Odinarchaeota archaeon]
MIPIIPIIIPPDRNRKNGRGEGAAILLVLFSIVIFGIMMIVPLIGLTGFNLSPVMLVIFGLVLFLLIGVAVAAAAGNSEDQFHDEESADEPHYRESRPRYRIAERRFCSKCGASLEADDRFCASCGWMIS